MNNCLECLSLNIKAMTIPSKTNLAAKTTNEKILSKLADDYPDVQMKVAQNNNAPEETVWKLAAHPDKKIRLAAQSNPKFSPNKMDDMLRTFVEKIINKKEELSDEEINRAVLASTAQIECFLDVVDELSLKINESDIKLLKLKMENGDPKEIEHLEKETRKLVDEYIKLQLSWDDALGRGKELKSQMSESTHNNLQKAFKNLGGLSGSKIK